MKTRIGAVGIIQNTDGEVLICKMPAKRGMYPEQWGILGGGMEDGEKIEDTLKREAKEELGIILKNIRPFTFHDDTRTKYFADGHTEEVYMVYCIFDCEIAGGNVVLNDEWEEFVWVNPERLSEYDLNDPTIKTFTLKGWL